MYLESLNIRGFGCLRTRVVFAPDKVNLAVAENETGKSTLIAAILAAFYGVEDDLRKYGKRPHRRNITPWTDPEQFGLELDFNSENRPWRIERDFNSGEVRLIDRGTGRDHADEYHRGRGSYHIGEEIIGLPVDEFLKSFYLKQEEILEIRESKGLTHYIQGVATTLEGGMSSELAIQRLRDARDCYPFEGSRDGLKIENAIKRLQGERDGCIAEIEKLERVRRDVEPETERLSQLKNDIERLRSERETALRQGDCAEIGELRKLIEAQQKLRAEVEQLALTAEELKSFEGFPAAKWEQLISLSQRESDLAASAAKLEARLREEALTPLAKLESDLQTHRDLAGVTEGEARDLEAGVSRLADRRERLDQARRSQQSLAEELRAAGHERERFSRLQGIFSGLSGEDRRFIEGFRATYAEEEAQYRELRTRREWNERERSLIVGRRQKIISTARFFFLLAAVTILAGGTLILLTKGEWLGQVLAGLGVVFGAVGAITRGTAGSADAGTLSKLDADLTLTIKLEDEARGRLERTLAGMTDLANRIGLDGGHELLSEYFLFDDLREKIEPLLGAEKEAARAADEFQSALQQLAPFFSRAGESVPLFDEAFESSRRLLGRYREVVRLGEEFKTVKARKNEFEVELAGRRREQDSNRISLFEILRLAGIEKSEPMDEAVAAFREALGQARRYQSIAGEQLPRLRQELLPDVDITAKKERLDQLFAKVTPPSSLPASYGGKELAHSKEYYRDLADQTVREEERLRGEREAINRRIVVTYDRYQNQYPEYRRKVEEIDDRLLQAESFRAEVDMAIGIMNDISREVYRSWAAALSEEAAPFLEALNPRYADLQFREDLTFAVRDRDAGRTLNSNEAEAILSTGARDEVFLAARLGIACYLARGARGVMPIVLDEPLSAVDDDKFVSGMRFFLERLSGKHQLLIMSCHEERHRWLEERIPDLFREKVHRMALNSDAAI